MASISKNGGFYNLSSGSGYQSSTNSMSKSQASNIVSKNNEAAARELQYNLGNKTAAQFNGLTSRDDYSGNDSYSSGSSSNTGGSGGSGGSKSAVANPNASADYLASLYASYAAQRQAALNEAYGRAVGNVNAGYDEAKSLLGSNFNAAKGALDSSYNNSLTNVQNDANKSLKEAYINRMLSQKNINQQLSAAGYSGGATETTLANMLNEYGNSRNNINTTLNDNIRELNATRDQNLASMLQSYNTNLANLASQRASALSNLEMALASGMADALDKQFSFQTSSGYMNALQNALQNMGSYQYTPTEASNGVTALSTQQGSIEDISNSTNYELLQRIYQMLAAKE